MAQAYTNVKSWLAVDWIPGSAYIYVSLSLSLSAYKLVLWFLLQHLREFICPQDTEYVFIMVLILPLINFYVVTDHRIQEVQLVQFRDVFANS